MAFLDSQEGKELKEIKVQLDTEGQMVFLGRKVRIKLKHLTVFKLVLHECTWSNNQLMELQQYYLICRVCHNSTVLYKKKNKHCHCTLCVL